MKEDIAENASAIEGVAGRMTTAEGKITAVEGAVATKAEKTYVDEQVQALQGVDTGLGNRITALEGKFGGAEGSVEDMIADAKAEAIATAGTNADTKDEAILAAAKQYAREEDAKIVSRVATLETESAKHALASDLTALAGRVETAEGEIDTLQSEMDAVEALAAANKAAHEANAAAIALKASQADLEAVSGRVTTLENWHNNFVECSQEDINGLFA
jgi:chromosome segregation ATPase